jgi:hypothetical protein
MKSLINYFSAVLEKLVLVNLEVMWRLVQTLPFSSTGSMIAV